MNKQDTEYFKKLLLQLRAEIVEQLKGTETGLGANVKDSSGDTSTISFHLADMGTDTMEREKTFWRASQNSKVLNEIDDALRKIENDEYSLCESCNLPINRQRLEAIPYAKLCIQCKANDEMSTN